MAGASAGCEGLCLPSGSSFYCRACSSKRKTGIQFTSQRESGGLEAGRKIKGKVDLEAVGDRKGLRLPTFLVASYLSEKGAGVC